MPRRLAPLPRIECAVSDPLFHAADLIGGERDAGVWRRHAIFGISRTQHLQKAAHLGTARLDDTRGLPARAVGQPQIASGIGAAMAFHAGPLEERADLVFERGRIGGGRIPRGEDAENECRDDGLPNREGNHDGPPIRGRIVLVTCSMMPAKAPVRLLPRALTMQQAVSDGVSAARVT